MQSKSGLEHALSWWTVKELLNPNRMGTCHHDSGLLPRQTFRNESLSRIVWYCWQEESLQAICYLSLSPSNLRAKLLFLFSSRFNAAHVNDMAWDRIFWFLSLAFSNLHCARWNESYLCWCNIKLTKTQRQDPFLGCPRTCATLPIVLVVHIEVVWIPAHPSLAIALGSSGWGSPRFQSLV